MPSRFRTLILQGALRVQAIDFRQSLKEAISHQALNHLELEQLQRQKLDRVVRLSGASNNCYRMLLRDRANIDLETDGSVPLSTFPTLTKEDLARISADVQSPTGFLRPIVKRTSGSSGRPLSLLKQRSGLAQELAATWRSYGWYGIAPGDRQVRVWGRPLNFRKRAYNAIKGIVLNSVQVSAFSVTDASLAQRIQRIRAIRPKFVYGYASALRELARFSFSKDLPISNSIRAVVSTAEPLDADTREVIQSGFCAPCRDEYGCSEVGSIAHECTQGRMHIMADNLIAEVLREDQTVAQFGFGELLITDLTNTLTPVIRYRVGDYCDIQPSNCSCGLTFPLVSRILGRVEDTITLADGTRHHPAMLCYLVDRIDGQFRVIDQYQVIQKQLDMFELRIVSNNSFPLSDFQVVAENNFRAALGDFLKVEVRRVDVIEREPSGKFRIVVGLENRRGASKI